MLKYLWEARMTDGSAISQTQADENEWGRFVLPRIDDVVALVLLRDCGNGMPQAGVVAVHMIDGHFEIGGNVFQALPFDMHRRPLTGGAYRPQRFRRVTQLLSDEGATEGPISYAIGWEYIEEGRVAWRVGGKVPVNVYEGDRPVCQCQTAEDAKRIVDAMNRTDKQVIEIY